MTETRPTEPLHPFPQPRANKQPVNVLIASGGRRTYLVRWFREALKRHGVPGQVVVTDANPYAPALADADASLVLPPFVESGYADALLRIIKDHDIGLAFSLNDYEASVWAQGLEGLMRDAGVKNVIVPSLQCQAVVEDKVAYAAALDAAGVATPATVTGAEALASRDLPWPGTHVLIKNRYGSASKGMTICAGDSWQSQLLVSVRSAAGRDGKLIQDPQQALDAVVLQPVLKGTEFGMDVVSDFDRAFCGVLVRTKLAMRAGETDQAITHCGRDFRELGSAISSVTNHRGLIDTDVIVDYDGKPWVIDINPRFGGGYPFSHVAGADIPSCYIAWHLGRPADASWLAPEAGVASAKTEELRVAVSRQGDERLASSG